ncbi:MAG: hypothetical protein KKD18_03445 [Nanoarchaeota archaeon]|nr:hypothetical protein [Nanoarchaeota archaeon]MBU0977445.1 hypothetical protein [Nanoarchaeota archaeon]
MRKEITWGLFFVFSIFILAILSATVSSKNINCGEDFNCFLQNAPNCVTSSVQSTTSIDLFGMKIITRTLLKIRPYKNKCELYVNNKYIAVKLTDELKNSLQSEGYTDKEIIRVERKATAEARENKGVAICRFDAAELTTLLANWGNGAFSSDDFNSAECKGKLAKK